MAVAQKLENSDGVSRSRRTKGGSVSAKKLAAKRVTKRFRLTKELDEFQASCIDLFVRYASVFGLPRSIGQVYGLLYATEEPLHLDDIIALLGASRGGTYDALAWLVHIGAVEKLRLSGVRREHFRAVLNLRQIASGYLKTRIEPHIKESARHIDDLRKTCVGTFEMSEFRRQRLEKISTWHRLLSDLLPMAKQIAAE